MYEENKTVSQKFFKSLVTRSGGWTIALDADTLP